MKKEKKRKGENMKSFIILTLASLILFLFISFVPVHAGGLI
jgi:hypothetical protein